MGAGWMAEVSRPRGWPFALLVVGNPTAGRLGSVKLWVTRLDANHRVPVEFTFRSVEGPSEQLGCVRA
jgi:hypothetical protein